MEFDLVFFTVKTNREGDLEESVLSTFWKTRLIANVLIP